MLYIYNIKNLFCIVLLYECKNNVKMKKHIPNLITSLNLVCGGIACIFILDGDFLIASILVLIGIFFDFFDGLAARMLNVSSALGLQLDSLADLVTSGLVPTLGVYFMLNELITENQPSQIEFYFPYLAFLILIGSAYRLAKFNIDARQTLAFIGLPTPSNALLVLSILLVIRYQEEFVFHSIIANSYFLILLSIGSLFLLNMEVTLFGLKFKSLKLQENWYRYFILILALALIGLFAYLGVFLSIIAYIILSIFIPKESTITK